MDAHSTASKVIRVAIVDDHPFFRQGVSDVLSAEADIEVVAQAADGQEALDIIPKVAPDVTLMDVNLPSINGLRATQQLKNTNPQLNFIILTAYDDQEQIYHAIRIGASAYFSKDVDPMQLIDTVRAVSEGYYVISGRRMTPEQAEQWLLAGYRRYGVTPEDDASHL